MVAGQRLMTARSCNQELPVDQGWNLETTNHNFCPKRGEHVKFCWFLTVEGGVDVTIHTLSSAVNSATQEFWTNDDIFHPFLPPWCLLSCGASSEFVHGHCLQDVSQRLGRSNTEHENPLGAPRCRCRPGLWQFLSGAQRDVGGSASKRLRQAGTNSLVVHLDIDQLLVGGILLVGHMWQS